MKKFTTITIIAMLSASFGNGLLADGKSFFLGNKGLLSGKKDAAQLKQSNGYLKHSLPTALSFGVDPLPADRLMLVTKAPKIPDTIPAVVSTVADDNTTVPADPFKPTETIDPPPPLTPTAPTLAVPALNNPSVLRPQGTPVLPSVVVTTDELLDILEIDSKSPARGKAGIVVPFEMPFSRTPAPAVYNSQTKTRYVKRIK